MYIWLFSWLINFCFFAITFILQKIQCAETIFGTVWLKKNKIVKIDWYYLKRWHSYSYFWKNVDTPKTPRYAICLTYIEFDYHMFEIFTSSTLILVLTLLTVKQPLIGRICHLFLTACCMLLLILTFPISGWFCFRVRNYVSIHHLTNIPVTSNS